MADGNNVLQLSLEDTSAQRLADQYFRAHSNNLADWRCRGERKAPHTCRSSPKHRQRRRRRHWSDKRKRRLCRELEQVLYAYTLHHDIHTTSTSKRREERACVCVCYVHVDICRRQTHSFEFSNCARTAMLEWVGDESAGITVGGAGEKSKRSV